jgi:antitoxin VapB
VAALTGETKTRAVKIAMQERRERLSRRVVHPDRAERLLRFLEREVWPLIPAEELGTPISRAEREEILGYGPDGV